MKTDMRVHDDEGDRCSRASTVYISPTAVSVVHDVLEVVADSVVACLLKNPWMKTGLGICVGEGDRFSGASTACISLIVASTMT
jgi:hypothetical protein